MPDGSCHAVSDLEVSGSDGAIHAAIETNLLESSSFREDVGADKIFELAQSGTDNVCELIVSTAQSVVKCDGCVLSYHEQGSISRVLYNSRVPANLAARIINADGTESAKNACNIRGPGVTISFYQLRVSPNGHESHNGNGNQRRGGHVTQIVLRKNGQEFWMLHLIRLEPAKPFEPSEIRLLGQLRPVFSSLLQRVEWATQSAMLGAAGWAILDQLFLGVCLLDGEGQVKAVNRKAFELLGEGDGLEIKNGRLGLTQAEDSKRFKNALRDLTASSDLTARALIADRPNTGTGLQLIFVRLRPLEDSGPSERPCIALFMADPTIVTGAHCLRELYGLTRVESEIANLICQGLSPGEVADKLRMSVHTVRGYLKPMFRKMGARRQADILRIVAAGSGLVQLGTKSAPAETRKEQAPSIANVLPALVTTNKKVADLSDAKRASV